MLYATRALASKLTHAIGAALSGAAITLIQFPDHAQPGHVEPHVLFNLALWDGVLVVLPGLVMVACFAQCRFTKADYETTRTALVGRRSDLLAATEREAATSAKAQIGSPSAAPSTPV